jgi:prevent-host-death family protein
LIVPVDAQVLEKSADSYDPIEMKISVGHRRKSDEVRQNWAEVIREVRNGEIVTIEHYNAPVARVVPAADDLVILQVPGANQAERLRRLVAEHGALGIPFPNNATAGWKVVDENGDPVNLHAIPNIKVQVIDTDQPDLASQIATSLGAYADDHNVDAIILELREVYGADVLKTIDSIPPAEYWRIVLKHEKNP